MTHLRKHPVLTALVVMLCAAGAWLFWQGMQEGTVLSHSGVSEKGESGGDASIMHPGNELADTSSDQADTLPPVPGAGSIEKRTDLDLTQAEAAEIVDEPSREVARYFLKAYYNFKTLDSDPNRVVFDFGKYATNEFNTLAINLPDVRNFGRDERKWEVVDIAFENAQYSADDLTQWHADVIVTLQEHEGVDVRVVRGRISTEPHAYPHHTGWFVSNWQGMS